MKYYIDECNFTINGTNTKLYKVHGDHCAEQYFTSFYEAERYIRLLSGFYGVNENVKIYKHWTYDSIGHEIKDL